MAKCLAGQKKFNIDSESDVHYLHEYNHIGSYIDFFTVRFLIIVTQYIIVDIQVGVSFFMPQLFTSVIAHEPQYDPMGFSDLSELSCI